MTPVLPADFALPLAIRDGRHHRQHVRQILRQQAVLPHRVCTAGTKISASVTATAARRQRDSDAGGHCQLGRRAQATRRFATTQTREQLDDIDPALAASPQQRTLQRLLLLARQARNALWRTAVRPRQRCGPATERMTPGEQFVSDASEAVHVIAGVRIAAIHALDARIRGRGSRRLRANRKPCADRAGGRARSRSRAHALRPSS